MTNPIDGNRRLPWKDFGGHQQSKKERANGRMGCDQARKVSIHRTTGVADDSAADSESQSCRAEQRRGGRGMQREKLLP